MKPLTMSTDADRVLHEWGDEPVPASYLDDAVCEIDALRACLAALEPVARAAVAVSKQLVYGEPPCTGRDDPSAAEDEIDALLDAVDALPADLRAELASDSAAGGGCN